VTFKGISQSHQQMRQSSKCIVYQFNQMQVLHPAQRGDFPSLIVVVCR